MFIIKLIKALMSKEEEEKKEPIPVKVVKIDINKLPKESQERIRRLYNKFNGIETEDK